MITQLNAGGLSFLGSSLRTLSENNGVTTEESEHPGDTASPSHNKIEGGKDARIVEGTGKSQTTGSDGEELSEEEERQVQELKQRDAEVRAHEQAHATAGGSYASAPTYEYTVGPDGKRYAVSGEVQIDASPVRDNPAATIRKMDIVIRAALAPAEPSSQDLQVAKQAQATRAKAQSDLLKQRLEEQQENKEDSPENVRLAARTAYETAIQAVAAATSQSTDKSSQTLFIA